MTNPLILQVDDLIFDKSEDGTSLRIYHRHYLDFDFTIDDLSELRSFLATKSSAVKLTETQIAMISELSYTSHSNGGFYVSDISQDIDSEKIEISITKGGSSGGSCWGGKSRSFSNDVSIDDVTIINKVLQTLVPGISAEKSRRIFYALLAECPTKENTEREYYGNYTDCEWWNIPLETLYKVVSEHI
jgi:hypothetical protein